MNSLKNVHYRPDMLFIYSVTVLMFVYIVILFVFVTAVRLLNFTRFCSLANRFRCILILFVAMPKINHDKTEFTFAPIGVDGSWRCTDSRYAGTLSDFLSLHELIIDDDCQFCRIIRYNGKFQFTYEYRCINSMQVRVTIYNTKII